jgi:hypothetical protein
MLSVVLIVIWTFVGVAAAATARAAGLGPPDRHPAGVLVAGGLGGLMGGLTVSVLTGDAAVIGGTAAALMTAVALVALFGAATDRPRRTE